MGTERKSLVADCLSLCFSALVLYLLLAQETYYGIDSHQLLQSAYFGETRCPYHIAYPPLLRMSAAIAAWFGGSVHTAGTVLSAVGTSIGVACAFLAFRWLDVPRSRAWPLAAMLATCPAVVFFATTVEIHGAHFGFCGLTFLAIAAFVRRPGARQGLVLGLATSLGYLCHSTGALLPLFALPVAFAAGHSDWVDPRAAFRGAVLAIVVHGIGVAVSPWLLAGTASTATHVEEASFLKQQWGHAALSQVSVWLETVWNDWLLAFVPLAWLVVASAFVPRSRAIALATAPALVVYLVCTAVLLGGATERGAYLLPLAWPAGLAIARWSPRPALLWIAAFLGAAVGIGTVIAFDQDDSRPFANGCREVLGDRSTFLLAGTHRELEALLSHLPEVRWTQPAHFLGASEDATRAALPGVDAWLQGCDAAGIEVWITEGAVAMLRDPQWSSNVHGGALLYEHLSGARRWERHESGAFLAWRLQPLPSSVPGPESTGSSR